MKKQKTAKVASLIEGLHLWKCGLSDSSSSDLWITTTAHDAGAAFRKAIAFLRKEDSKATLQSVRYKGTLDA
jgi:hypothetical protein